MLLSLLLLTVSPAAANAHVHLVSATPRATARLTESPREIVLTFSGSPERSETDVELWGTTRRIVLTLAPALASESARTVRATVPELLAAGTYAVRWRTASADGHIAKGSYTFVMVKSSATGPEAALAPLASRQHAPAADTQGTVDTTARDGGASDFGVSSPAYVAIRWIGYAALMMVVGAVAYRWVVLGRLVRGMSWPREETVASERAASALGALAAGALALDAGARLLAQSWALTGGEDALAGSTLVPLILHTSWGHGWLMQVLASGLMAGALLSARRARAWGWTCAALLTVPLVLAPALSGHAMDEGSLTPLSVASDMIHIAGAAGWLGTLCVMAFAGFPVALRAPAPERAHRALALVQTFSPLALVCAAATVATGLLAAWLHLGSLAQLWRSEYGRVLLIKLACVALVATAGAFNWRRLTPRLLDPRGALRIRRSATIELAFAALVLGATAVLVATSPPSRDEAAVAGAGAVGQLSGNAP